MKTIWKNIQKHLLSGVSFTIPVVVAGGVTLAVSLLGATQTEAGPIPNGPLLTYLNQLGKAGMVMMIPAFAAYILYSVAGKPGLTPGFILGYIINNAIMINGAEVRAGLLGAFILGLFADYMAKWTRGLKVGETIRSIMPILAILISTILVLGLAYYLIIRYPTSSLMQALSDLMVTLNGSGKAVLAVFMGLFSEIDFGGPVIKAVSVFALSMTNEGIMEPNGTFRIPVAVPPIGIFLSMVIARKKYSEEERDNAKAVGIMGCPGITGGATPYAIKDPKVVYPVCITGNTVGALIGAFGNVACPVSHGGFIVFPVVENQPWFVVATLVGSAITVLPLRVLRKDVLEER